MEPERQIERCLRNAAKQRRDQAGAPFELHPATRRLLQGEVTRHYAAVRPKLSRGLAWSRLFSRLAWSLGLALALSVGFWMLGPDLRRAKTELAMGVKPETDTQPPGEVASAPAVPSLKPVASFETRSGLVGEIRKQAVKDADMLTPHEHPTDGILLSPRTGHDKPKGTTIAAPAALPVPTASAEAGKKEAEALRSMALAQTSTPSDQAMVAQTSSRLGTTDSYAAPGIAAAPPAPVALPRGEGLSLGLASKSGVQHSLNYSAAVTANQWRQISPAQMKSQLNQAAVAQVLSNFAIEQEDGKLKVIDEDGSVYAGSLELAATPARRTRAAQPPAAARVVRDGGALAVSGPAESPKDGAAAMQSYFFRVVGTNRSLNQKVVFTGNLIAEAGIVKGGVTNALQFQAGQGALLDRSLQQARERLPQSRISGKAQIGGQPEMDIIAAPVQSQDSK